jgi:hypothetical protein
MDAQKAKKMHCTCAKQMMRDLMQAINRGEHDQAASLAYAAALAVKNYRRERKGQQNAR